MAVELTSHTDQHTSKHRYDTLDFSFAYPYALTLSRHGASPSRRM